MNTRSSARPAAAPFVASNSSVGQVMRRVIYALLPGAALYAWFFGWGVLLNILWALGSALAFEALMLSIRGVRLRPFLADGSAALTALLLALSLPPMLPWWVPVVGSFIAIVFAKHLYGGLGNNPFNPAMAAFAVLLIAFPRELSLWSLPLDRQADAPGLFEAWMFSLDGRLPLATAFDAITGATPLDAMRTGIGRGLESTAIREAGVFGQIAGYGTEWVSLAYLAGGLMLLWLRIISWHIPVAILLALAVAATTGYLLGSTNGLDPGLHLLAGGTMLGAFFIATDPVTAATTAIGKLIYGAGIGLLVYAIRTWGAYPDGVAFAVLLMGMTVPLLDQYAISRVFGARAGEERVR